MIGNDVIVEIKKSSRRARRQILQKVKERDMESRREKLSKLDG